LLYGTIFTNKPPEPKYTVDEIVEKMCKIKYLSEYTDYNIDEMVDDLWEDIELDDTGELLQELRDCDGNIEVMLEHRIMETDNFPESSNDFVRK